MKMKEGEQALVTIAPQVGSLERCCVAACWGVGRQRRGSESR